MNEISKRIKQSEEKTSIFSRKIKWCEYLRVILEVVSSLAGSIYYYYSQVSNEYRFVFLVVEFLYILIVLIQNVHSVEEIEISQNVSSRYQLESIKVRFENEKHKIEQRGRFTEIWGLILVFGTLGIFKQIGENHPTIWYILISIYLMFICLSSLFVCY